MLEKVKLIARNPLAASTDQVDEAGVMNFMNKNQKANKDKKKAEAEYETAILEKAIVKIGHLLALGFGVAGSKIIADNMQKGGDVNPMIPGQKVYIMVGFVHIRAFTECTEVLQEKVMTFVNQIAEIVHSQVDKYGGAVNKNIGDVFLLVWKFNDMQDFEYAKLNPSREHQRQADLALFSFIKCIAKINKMQHILEYR